MTEKDLRILRNSRKKTVRYLLPAFLFANALLNLAACFWNLRQCDKIASYENLNLSDVFRRWIDGADVQMLYSGVYLAALERLTTGMLQALCAIVMLIATLSVVIVNRRHRRILAYIESKDEALR